ncbi:hypothetical protein PFISCL1PPCAC_25008, partial [Pristionchus fissidentatus]
IAACDQSLIRDFNPSQMTYDNNILKCNNENEEIVFRDERTSEVSCDPSGEWSGGSNSGILAHDVIDVECKAKACDQSLIR